MVKVYIKVYILYILCILYTIYKSICFIYTFTSAVVKKEDLPLKKQIEFLTFVSVRPDDGSLSGNLVACGCFYKVMCWM